MTKARKEQVSLEATPFYHCYVRCVRRAYLCGEDRITGENFDHRKQWIVSRLRFLSYVYAIDVCAYAVMSNHYHAVLHVDKTRAESWSLQEVAERWMQLYSGHVLVDRWLANPDDMDDATMIMVEDIVEEWRARLFDIGWFMRGVNETIARMANEEENCKGRFWEGRYKSQALLDHTALLSCMVYVDLNPVRAGISDDLYHSDFTSIQQRLFDFIKPKSRLSKGEVVLEKRVENQRDIKKALKLDSLPEAQLMDFDSSRHKPICAAIPFTQEDYFALVDSTGRISRQDKRGAIDAKTLPIIQSLGINPNKWIQHIHNFGRTYANCVGSVENIKAYASRFEKRWCKGVGFTAELCAG